MKVLIVGDKINQLSGETDTGLNLLRSALKRSHDVDWVEWPQFWVDAADGLARLKVKSQRVLSCEEGQLPKIGEIHPAWVGEYDTVWIRKDPPFDSTYLSFCWWLLGETAHTLVLNSPDHLVRYHEKWIPYLGVQSGALSQQDVIPTWILPESIKPSSVEQKESQTGWITKPWFGHGGNSVQKWDALKDISSLKETHLIQPFVPEVQQTGDRRVFFIDGKFVGSFVRMPKSGSIQSNLSQGGSAVKKELSQNEKKLIPKLEKYFQSLGLFIVGADFLNGKLSEVNITAPTGFQQIRTLEGLDLGESYVKKVEERLSGGA